MAKIELLVPHLLKWEGGFVVHPNDPGGATNKGITFAVFKEYCRKKGRPTPTIEDLKNISDDDWSDIIVTGYWNKMQADKIQNQSVANIMVDWLVNSGTGKIKNIQKIVSVKDDGIVGEKTLKAINESDQEHLFKQVKFARLVFYNNLVLSNPKMEVFRNGWLNRLNDYNYEKQD